MEHGLIHRNRGRRLTKIGAMYKYTPVESNPEGTRVWEHTRKHKVCLSASADAGKLERGTREPKEREYTKNGRSAIHIYMSGKSPGKMSRQTNRSVQTHYFKFKHQFNASVTQCATTIPLYPAIALSTVFYHNYSPFLAIRPRICTISSAKE